LARGDPTPSYLSQHALPVGEGVHMKYRSASSLARLSSTAWRILSTAIDTIEIGIFALFAAVAATSFDQPARISSNGWGRLRECISVA
jgi:hypothetical protein